MRLLENTVQEYAWGSRTAIAQLLGQSTPSPRPQAELWMGAHPLAPSRLKGESGTTLLQLLQKEPQSALGATLNGRYEGKLPFLLKVLAAETPLSLQAHPSLAQAQEGYARENREGVPLTAGNRNYKDANHKPELLCALGPFDALCGFRSAPQTLQLFKRLNVPALEPAVSTLAATPDRRGIRIVFEGFMRLPAAAQHDVAESCERACRAVAQAGGPFANECAWAAKLAKLYPGDVGAVSALMLNLVHLEAGEAIYLPAGNLHAYLRGTGVELMANSDNVLRGGLTPKHVDVNELLHVLDFTEGPITVVRPTALGACEQVYSTPVAEFRLSRIEVRAEERCRPVRRGPEILLCTEGSLTAEGKAGTVLLPRGASAFVAADEPPYVLSGAGTIFRATVGQAL